MGLSATAKDTQDADCPTLETLMQRAQAGDASAYHLLFSEVANRMRRLVRRRAPWLRHEDVKDIVQGPYIRGATPGTPRARSCRGLSPLRGRALAWHTVVWMSAGLGADGRRRGANSP